MTTVSDSVRKLEAVNQGNLHIHRLSTKKCKRLWLVKFVSALYYRLGGSVFSYCNRNFLNCTEFLNQCCFSCGMAIKAASRPASTTVTTIIH